MSRAREDASLLGGGRWCCGDLPGGWATSVWVPKKGCSQPHFWALWIDFHRLWFLGWELCGHGCGLEASGVRDTQGGKSGGWRVTDSG